MNDLIKELALQAGCDYLYDYSANGHAMVCNVDDIEKFAELIVRDCEQVSLKNSHRDDDMGAIVAKQIKKHFGLNNEHL